MGALVTWFDQARQGELHPLIAIGIFIVVFLAIHPFQTVADAVAITGASRNTLKVHFKALCEQGLLVLHGQGRGAWYSMP